MSDDERHKESLSKNIEQFYSETSEALERFTVAQAELLSKAAEGLTRGYVGVLYGTAGAFSGFVEGFSRAWQKQKPGA
jgi:hypothetical protein